MTREEFSDMIYESLIKKQDILRSHYEETKGAIGYFFIDDLLPEAVAQNIYTAFPNKENFVSKKNLREYKHIAVQMDQYNPILEEITYAFQTEKVVNLIASICDAKSVLPDKDLYAGGLSMMEKDNFLNPHLDNSHNKSMQLFRVFNLLYYVTPDWKLEYGGNLELWPQGLDSNPITVESSFNRLVVMATHKKSWHSVSKVEVNKPRCCVSNYYFSPVSLDDSDSFHVTTFRARPENWKNGILLKLDSSLRTFIRKLFPTGIKENKHYYDRKD